MMYRHLLVPTDGSTLSLKAARSAVRLAKELQAKITALYVIPPYTPPSGGDGVIYYPEMFSPREYRRITEEHAGKALSKVKAAASAAKVTCATLFATSNQPWQAIINTARAKRCDLIVMASHGRRGIAGLLLGSETTKVLTHSRTPVLVCR